MSLYFPLIPPEDGMFEIHDEDYEMSVHCKNEKGKQLVEKRLKAAYRMQWSKTSENPPTKWDANKFGMVIVWCSGAEEASKTKWELVASMPECYQFWMPMPEPPEEIENETD